MSKLDNKKILACCANGAGSSLMMEQAINKVMKKFEIKPASITHCPISEGKSSAKNYDLVFCAKTFIKNFEDAQNAGVTVIPLKNVMSAQEIEAALVERDLI